MLYPCGGKCALTTKEHESGRDDVFLRRRVSSTLASREGPARQVADEAPDRGGISGAPAAGPRGPARPPGHVGDASMTHSTPTDSSVPRPRAPRGVLLVPQIPPKPDSFRGQGCARPGGPGAAALK